MNSRQKLVQPFLKFFRGFHAVHAYILMTNRKRAMQMAVYLHRRLYIECIPTIYKMEDFYYEGYRENVCEH